VPPHSNVYGGADDDLRLRPGNRQRVYCRVPFERHQGWGGDWSRLVAPERFHPNPFELVAVSVVRTSPPTACVQPCQRSDSCEKVPACEVVERSGLYR